jgi:hypothetical protein
VGDLAFFSSLLPDLVECVCSDRSLLDCAMSYNTPACTQAGQAVGTCQRQNCAAQCTPPKSADGTTTPAPALPAAPPGEDSCAALTACYPKATAAMQGSCTSMTTMKNQPQRGFRAPESERRELGRVRLHGPAIA